MQRDLVERAIRGDQEAFSRLVDASADRLYGVAILILHDPDRAQDAVQEALVSAWRNVRALRDPDAWGPWMYRLTVWACRRVARKETRRSLVELQVVPDHDPALAFDLVGAFADRDLIERSLSHLTLDHRAVIVLRYYADLPLEDVARILDIPTGTAKSRLHRGLGVMRAAIVLPPDGPSRAPEVSA